MPRVLLTALLLGTGLSAAVRLTWAEMLFRTGSSPQVRYALRVLGSTPNADYLERLADLDPSAEEERLRQALAENPRLTSAGLRLGLLQEQRGNFIEAERTLLAAARCDHQVPPAWTLANFYFRRGDSGVFWTWSRRVVQMNSGDARPLLRLASLLDRNETDVLERLQGDSRLTYSYLDVLIGAGRLDAAQNVARLALRAHWIRKDSLLDLSSRQLRAGHIRWALELWNEIESPLDPEHGPALAEPVFLSPDGVGFHARPSTHPGILVRWQADQAAFTLQGSQADTCRMFEQVVPAPGGSVRYRLTYEYRSSATGIRWSLAGIESPVLPVRPDWQGAEWNVTVPSGETMEGLRALPLQFLYRREPGTTPAQGEIELRKVELRIL